MDLSFLPAVNACLNAIATVMLVIGFVLIKQRRIGGHRVCMLSAFATSTLFLILYVGHKAWKASSGAGLHTTFNREGPARTLYLIILCSHLILAVLVPILAVRLIQLGLSQRYHAHRSLAKFGYPIWMYVSITGVLIYLMLYHWNVPLR